MFVSEIQSYPLTVPPAYPVLDIRGDLKVEPEDFVVHEMLGFEPSGEGEHLWLFVEKRLLTTQAILGDISKALGVSRKDMGHSGLKDKFAITRQWISVPWPMKTPLPEIEGRERWQVLSMKRHDRKLKRGVHKANQFILRLTNLEGQSDWQKALEERLTTIGKEGIPNYFGEQRFGYEGGNVEKARQLFSGELKCKRSERGMYLSAARSYLFNQYLAYRIEAGNWLTCIEGDYFNLEGSGSFFGPEPASSELLTRLKEKDIHIAGPMVGERQQLTADAAAIEGEIRQRYPELVTGLAAARVESGLRALCVVPKDLQWDWQDNNNLQVSFSLPSGAFATALVHEMIQVNGAQW